MQPSDVQVVIDLGDRDWSADDRRPRRRVRRLPLAVLLAMCVLVVLPASAAPTSLVARPLWQVPGRDFQVFGEYVFVVDRVAQPMISARALSTGEELWHRTMDTPEFSLSDLGDGLIGLTRYNQLVPSNFDGGATEIVQAATGRLVRVLDGAMIGPTPQLGAVVVGQRAADGRAPLCRDTQCEVFRFYAVDGTTGQIVVIDGAGGEGTVACPLVATCGDIVAVNPRTGAEVWRIPAQPDRAALWRRDGERVTGLGMLDTRGHLVTFDLATGRESGDTSVPYWDGSLLPAEAVSSGRFYYLDDVLVDLHRGDEDGLGTISAVRLTDGRVWSATLPSVSTQYTGPFYAWSCGRSVCLWLGESSLMVDPATGALMGKTRSYAISIGTGDLFAWDTDPDGKYNRGMSIYDLSTREVTGTVAGEFQIVEHPGHLPLAVVPGGLSRGSDVYAITDDGRVKLVASIEPASFCVASEQVLICADQPASGGMAHISAWRLPPAAG